MPSIEIICVGQEEVSDFSDAPFRVFAEDELVSDRSPKPLFKPEFDATAGCIYHLCNPDGSYNAFELLRMGHYNKRRLWKGMVGFRPEYAPYVRQMLRQLLKASPTHEVIFTSDYQFGPGVRRYHSSITLRKFWRLHHARRLHMNALYHLRP
ncbi:MAG: hypothetical protein H7308_12105 [Chthonomonadaceae bacterium]|nr:hypothetical protein [Chthonomonadaceae bacterium]